MIRSQSREDFEDRAVDQPLGTHARDANMLRVGPTHDQRAVQVDDSHRHRRDDVIDQRLLARQLAVALGDLGFDAQAMVLKRRVRLLQGSGTQGGLGFGAQTHELGGSGLGDQVQQ
ncbi:hypothetical protein D3C87_739390 [compost metagenome]